VAATDPRASDLLRYNQLHMHLAATHGPGTVSKSQVREEFDALLSGCGTYPLGSALVSVAGRDRVRWLNGMISNNIRDLAPGHGVYGFVLNPQGHIQADLYVFHDGEKLLIEIERSQRDTVLSLFRRYIIMDKVEVEDSSDKFRIFGVAGRKAEQVLSTLAWRKQLEPLEFGRWFLNGGELTVVRKDNQAIPSYELWVPQELADQTWRALEASGAHTIHEEVLESWRVISGIPRFGQDIRNRDLPQETGQDRALNFNKGCYIGQEIVERVRSRGSVHRAFVGFEVEGAGPEPGSKIQSEGKDVGEITTSTWVPTAEGERAIAMGYLRKEFLEPGKELRVGASRIQVRSFPFREFLVPG